MLNEFFTYAMRKTVGKTVENFIKRGFVLSAMILIAAAFAAAKPKTLNQKPPKYGKVKGTIYIKNISGNIGNSLKCQDLNIVVKPLSTFTGQAKGDITTGKCSYLLVEIAPDTNFVLEIPKPKIFKVCDTSAFEVDGMFPQKIKPFETRVINLMIRKATCTQVK
ncbi:MAG: hypothetical protein ACR2MG_02915 [Pyrinomonadaceae bacterium]